MARKKDRIERGAELLTSLVQQHMVGLSHAQRDKNVRILEKAAAKIGDGVRAKSARRSPTLLDQRTASRKA